VKLKKGVSASVTADQALRVTGPGVPPLSIGSAPLRVRTLRPLLTLSGASSSAARFEKVRSRFAARAGRAPGDVAPPTLDGIYVLETKNPAEEMRALAALQAHPAVVYAQRDFRVATTTVPDDPYYGSFGTWGSDYLDLWGLHRMDAARAWDLTRVTVTLAP
jgi:hypothetical protein